MTNLNYEVSVDKKLPTAQDSGFEILIFLSNQTLGNLTDFSDGRLYWPSIDSYIMYLFHINKKKFVVSVLIGIFAWIGDKNVENSPNRLSAAINDNATHAFIGVLTWIGMFVAKTAKVDFYFLTEIVLCGFCSAIIDVDHFIAAKSIYLKDATNLKSRPFLHSTSLGLVIIFSTFFLSHLFKLSWLYKFGWILTAAILSHHIRDSKRRGFWLWPLGSTIPTPTFLYFIIQMLLPHILSAIISVTSSSELFKSEPITSVETV